MWAEHLWLWRLGVLGQLPLKPGDHPDFFRFPAPPGRSRESSLRLDAKGTFWHEQQRVEHPRMTRALFSWASLHPEDGRPILTNGYDWTYYEVVDVPLLVTGVFSAASRCMLRLSDGSAEELRPGTLALGTLGLGGSDAARLAFSRGVRQSEALYCWVRDGTLPARFTQQAQTGLEPWVYEEEASVGVELGGVRFPITGADDGPG